MRSRPTGIIARHEVRGSFSYWIYMSHVTCCLLGASAVWALRKGHSGKGHWYSRFMPWRKELDTAATCLYTTSHCTLAELCQ